MAGYLEVGTFGRSGAPLIWFPIFQSSSSASRTPLGPIAWCCWTVMLKMSGTPFAVGSACTDGADGAAAGFGASAVAVAVAGVWTAGGADGFPSLSAAIVCPHQAATSDGFAARIRSPRIRL